jgi:hypothetical protein
MVIRAADSRQTTASKLAEQAFKNKEEVMLPPEYQEFAKVFSEDVMNCENPGCGHVV